MQHNIHCRLDHHLRYNFHTRAIPCSGNSRYRHWYCPGSKSHVRVRNRQNQIQGIRNYSNRSERIYRVTVNMHDRSLANVRDSPGGSCNTILFILLIEHDFTRNCVFLGGKRSGEASMQIDIILQRHRRFCTSEHGTA
jgi:hypothetical protein